MTDPTPAQMQATQARLRYSFRATQAPPIRSALVDALAALQPGDKVKVVHEPDRQMPTFTPEVRNGIEYAPDDVVRRVVAEGAHRWARLLNRLAD